MFYYVFSYFTLFIILLIIGQFIKYKFLKSYYNKKYNPTEGFLGNVPSIRDITDTVSSEPVNEDARKLNTALRNYNIVDNLDLSSSQRDRIINFIPLYKEILNRALNDVDCEKNPEDCNKVLYEYRKLRRDVNFAEIIDSYLNDISNVNCNKDPHICENIRIILSKITEV